jgi:hypothetical protein
LGQIFFNCNKINFPSTIPSEAWASINIY